MSNKVKITEELKSEVLTYWRDTVKDKDAVARTADLFGLREEDVKRIIAVRWREKFRWSEDNIFRLKAYMAQGMKITEIAKQLGCKPQVIYDFRRRNKNVFDKMQNEKSAESCRVRPYAVARDSDIEPKECHVVARDSDIDMKLGDVGKKKESLTLGDAKDSEKNTIVEVDSSVNDYSTEERESQELAEKSGSVGDEITTEMYNDLHTRFWKLHGENEDAGMVLEDVLLILKTAKYAGVQWCERHETLGNELSDCCRMYDMMLSQALETLSGALDILENGNDR